MKLKIVTGLCLLCLVFIASCESDAQMEFDRYYSAGRTLYQSKCQNCHGDKGDGLLALFPPLTDSAYLKNNKSALACIVRNGLTKQTAIGGKLFDGQMPGNDLPPIQIAEVLTYVTNSFGNKIGIVGLNAVEDDLNKCDK